MLKEEAMLINDDDVNEDDDDESHKDDDDTNHTGDLNVWKFLLDELKNDEEKAGGRVAIDRHKVLKKLRCYLLLCRSLKRDKIFRSIMKWYGKICTNR